MDKSDLITGTILATGLYFLGKDSLSRRNFNQLVDTGFDKKNRLVTGTVSNPVPKLTPTIKNSEGDEVIASESKHYEYKSVIVSDITECDNMPRSNIRNQWSLTEKKSQLASTFTIGVANKETFKTNDYTKVFYNDSQVSEKGFKIIKERMIPSNSEISVYHRKGVPAALAMGKKEDVVNSVRSDVYGINNWKTFGYVSMVAGSLFYLSMNSYKKFCYPQLRKNGH
jgi:hypothetical protein